MAQSQPGPRPQNDTFTGPINNLLAQGAWAIDEDRNAWVYLTTPDPANTGWTQIQAGSDSIFSNLLSQLLAAKATGQPEYVYENQGAITNINVPPQPKGVPPPPKSVPTNEVGTTWQKDARVTTLGSSNQDRNKVWMYIRDNSTNTDIGWVRLSSTSESGQVALNMLASSALITGRRLDYRWDQQASDEMGATSVAHAIYFL